MTNRSKKPWSAGKEAEMFPSLHGLPAHEPKPLPGNGGAVAVDRGGDATAA